MNSRRLIIACAAIVGLFALSWVMGFVMYVRSIERMEAEPPGVAATDAIVVLTGGSGRVNVGLDLFKDHKGKKLFISGVYPGLTLEHVIGNAAVAKDQQVCCIKLDHTAETTFGNAWETRAWMEGEGFHSLRLVTANYHMPRSLMIFHAIMPDLTIIPHMVTPDSVKLDGWWRRPGTASLLFTEYNKFLLAEFRLWIGSA